MDAELFIAGAIDRVPPGQRDCAIEIGAGPASALLGCKFKRIEAAGLDALSAQPPGGFAFVLATRVLEEATAPGPVVNCLREASRMLRENGLLCARLNALPGSATRFSTGELVELARDLDFQILIVDGAGSKAMSLLWRKRAAGWRADLADQAPLASVQIRRITNAFDGEPVTPARGPYAAIQITIEGLPGDVDLFDLEVLVGGGWATLTAIGEPDARGFQAIRAVLPSLEQTGLLPVELRWFGEPLTAHPAMLRVIPPGPGVPRVVGISGGAARLVNMTFSLEDLARPDEFTVTINGRQVWGVEVFCTDPAAQAYDVRFQLPEELAPGPHEVQMMAGRRKLAPIMIEIG